MSAHVHFREVKNCVLSTALVRHGAPSHAVDIMSFTMWDESAVRFRDKFSDAVGHILGVVISAARSTRVLNVGEGTIVDAGGIVIPFVPDGMRGHSLVA